MAMKRREVLKSAATAAALGALPAPLAQGMSRVATAPADGARPRVPDAGRRFLYHGGGVALSGWLGDPAQGALGTHAAAWLGPSGGAGETRVKNLSRGPVSVREALTRVSGRPGARGTFETTVECVVEGLAIGDLLTAERLVARLASRHPGDDRPAAFWPTGTRIEGLRVAGAPVTFTPRVEAFATLGTTPSLRAALHDDASFRDMAATDALWRGVDGEASATLRARHEWMRTSLDDGRLPEAHGFVFCALFGDVACKAGQTRCFGNVLEIPGVARVTLGEYLVSAASRRLTLLRVELNAANSGVIETGPVETNGHPIP